LSVSRLSGRGLRGGKQILSNQGRLEASVFPVASFSEDTGRDGGTHICETFVDVSILEGILRRDNRGAPSSLPEARPGVESGPLPFAIVPEQNRRPIRRACSIFGLGIEISILARWGAPLSSVVLPDPSTTAHVWDDDMLRNGVLPEVARRSLIYVPGAIFDGSVTGVGREQDRTSRYPEARKALRNRY
jgi:hypothetical protein